MNTQVAASDDILRALFGPDPAPFAHLITQLMSASNEDRGQAEAIYNQCKTSQPEPLALKLLYVLRNSGQKELRDLTAILLRKCIAKDGILGKLSPTGQSTLKSQLLEAVQQESIQSNTKKLCDTVGELAIHVLEEGQWPELLPFLFHAISSPSDRLKESSLLIFAQLAQYLVSTLSPHFDTLITVLQQSLATSANGDVRMAALRASANLIQSLDSARERERFQVLIPAMLQSLTVALNSGEEAAAQEALEMFIEIAGAEPRFLRRQLAEVVATMLQVAEARDTLEESTRQLALEFLVTLVEAREQAPGMMKKLPHVIGRLFALLLRMLEEVEDDPAWHSAASEDDDVDGAEYEVAQECLDRAAMSLQGNTVLPVASQLMPALLADGDWKKRHAALVALAQIAEGCAKVMIQSLDSVVPLVLTSMADPHPRVRWAAINALGQLCTDLGPTLQEKFHALCMPALIAAMDDAANPRVQAHAAAAVLNFSEGAPAEVLKPYLDAVVSKLIGLLERGNRMVQEGAVTSLAAVADRAQDEFVKYYDTVMPYLKSILVNCTDKEHRMLRSKAMECISLVGMAVGKDKFRPDARQVIDTLLLLQQQQEALLAASPASDLVDPTLSSYMLQAWARLCKCLGHEFLPFMAAVMPALLASAALKPDVTVTDADEEEEEEDDEDDSIETIMIGDKKIGIRTSVLEEKATACSMLCCYADELKEGFFPWVDQVAELMVPLLKFYFHEEVRKAAVQSLPELIKSAKLAVEKGQAVREPGYLKQLLDYLLNPLVELLSKEPDVEILIEMLESLNECIQTVGPLLDPTQIKSICGQLVVVTKESSARKAERSERRHTEDFDEEEQEILEEENEQEDAVFEQVGEVIGTLIKTYKEAFSPFFDEFVPLVVPFMQKTASPGERRIAICIFDDLAEYFGPVSYKYYDIFLPLILEACNDENADVRQASVYGIGICAQFGGAAFAPRVAEALARLTAVVSQPDCRSTDNESATDNAISSIGKICEFQSEGFDAGQVLTSWLNYLPMKSDLVESKVVHQQLCSFVERADSRLLGPSFQNLPKVISVFADVLNGGTTYATEETSKRMVNVLKQLQQSAPQEALAAAWSTLSSQQQACLQNSLSG